MKARQNQRAVTNQPMAVTKNLTFDENEWYELTVLLERGIQRMQIMYDQEDPIAQKWIERYARMIREINK